MYKTSTTELRRAAITGCKWCQTLADGIHGRIFLDCVYERCNHTDSDPSTANSEDGAVGDGDHEVASDSPAADGDVGSDPFRNFDLDPDLDSLLLLDRDVSIKLAFQKDGGGLFSILRVHIESVSASSDKQHSPTPRLHGEESVDLIYNVHMNLASLSRDKAEQRDSGPSKKPQRDITSLFPANIVAVTLGAEASIDRLSAWVQSIHPHPKAPLKDSLCVPSRLIKIDAPGLRIVRTSDLADNDNDTRGYVALSYVWGASQTFVLRSDSQSLLTRCFSNEQLPQTIQDAVAVSRKLGFRYLWVDALCILQDSDEDKNRELPKMGNIYQSASLTLVAAVAKSAADGFLHTQEQKFYHINPFQVPYFSDVRTSDEQTITLSYPADYKRWKDPINDRGWIFQEFLLSPFIASFSYRGVETINRYYSAPVSGSVSDSNVLLPGLDWRQSIFDLSSGSKIRETWLAVRGEYSQRRLGHVEDKLAAIAAVAEQVGKSYDTRYLAGMWESDLANDLKWCHADVVYSEGPTQAQRPRRMPRPAIYIAPSWSWASIDGPIDDYTFEGGSPVKDWLGFEVIRCEVSPAIPDFQYGAVTTGTLTVRARMHSFFWRPEDSPTLDCDGFLAVKTNEEPWEEWKVGEVILDCLDPTMTDGCIVDCLAVSLVERIPGRDEIECLVLLPAEEESHRRVGFGKVSVTALYDDEELFEIQII